MREIEFRGKWSHNGKWIYGSLTDKNNGERLISDRSRLDGFDGRYVIPETVGQFTGLKDKNGVKIFEGDVVDFTDFNGISGGETQYKGVVKFSDGQWEIWQHPDFEYYDGANGAFHLYWAFNNDCELCVIGSIHDSPELLGGAE